MLRKFPTFSVMLIERTSSNDTYVDDNNNVNTYSDFISTFTPSIRDEPGTVASSHPPNEYIQSHYCDPTSSQQQQPCYIWPGLKYSSPKNNVTPPIGQYMQLLFERDSPPGQKHTRIPFCNLLRFGADDALVAYFAGKSLRQ